MTVNLAVLASGRGSNFAAIADSCASDRLEAQVAVLVSNKSNAVVRERARNRDINERFIEYDDSNRERFERKAADIINQHDCQLVALAGFTKVLTPLFINEFQDRILNIHPSLLPSFKGLNAQKQALDYGVKVTGCTVHVVTEELDSGPIVDQKAVRVKDGDSVSSLSERILQKEHQLYTEALKQYIESGFQTRNTATPVSNPQTREARSES